MAETPSCRSHQHRLRGNSQEEGDRRAGERGPDVRQAATQEAQQGTRTGSRDAVLKTVNRRGEARIFDGAQHAVGGDVIVGIDGARVTTMHDLLAYMAENNRPGDSVTLEVIRDDGEHDPDEWCPPGMTCEEADYKNSCYSYCKWRKPNRESSV